MIISIKEAAVLLAKLAQYNPDENVELKFLESAPAYPRSIPPSILGPAYATITIEKDPGPESMPYIPAMRNETYGGRVPNKPWCFN